MLNLDIADSLAAGGLLLFTGADITATDSIIEIISKFGVVAVLWYWLKDMKSQMKTLTVTFDKETDEIRTHYEKIIIKIREEHRSDLEKYDTKLEKKDLEKDNLQNKLYNLIEKCKEEIKAD
jgi:hypothetical protein